jgi:hypothetical protein
MRITSEKQASEFLYDRIDTSAPVHRSLLMRMSTDRCMYEGIHWLESGGDFPRTATAGRRSPNWNPDSNKGLRTTVNRIIPLIRESAAATNPSLMELNVLPPDREMGIESSERAQVIEAAANVAIDKSGFLAAARNANHRRSIDGVHGIGLRIKMSQRQVAEAQYEQDQIMTAFAFDATDLVLDPHNQNTDLCQHDEVIYQKVWTQKAIRDNFGVDLPDDELSTIGDLCKLQMELNRLSENRLYANLPKYSKTKGALVHQLHIKDDEGYRFGTMLIGITTAKGAETGRVRWINMDNPETPFGGDGLPLALLHGARRPDSMWSMSDVYLIKDDQDRINLLNTLTFRHLHASGIFKFIVAEEAIKDKDVFSQQITNRIGGPLFYSRGQHDRPNLPPQIQTIPPPQPFLTELATMYEQSQRRMVHRHEVTTGQTKSHVPNETFQSALNQAGQVLGIRVQEDTLVYEKLLHTMVCTTVKMANEGSPSALAMLGQAGFDGQDFAQIYNTDHFDLGGCRIKLRESSIRNTSKEEKEQRLTNAMQFKAISPMKYRIALGELDTPLDDSDKRMMSYAKKAAIEVLLGVEWQPVPLGEYSEVFLNQFREAVFDRRAKEDPEARARLDRAIQSQLVYTQYELGMMQPAQPMEGQAGGEQEAEQEMPEEVDLAQLITSLSSGAGGQMAQPSAA